MVRLNVSQTKDAYCFPLSLKCMHSLGWSVQLLLDSLESYHPICPRAVETIQQIFPERLTEVYWLKEKIHRSHKVYYICHIVNSIDNCGYQ